MAEFFASAAANTVGNLATPYASPYVSYFFDFGKIVEDFKHGRNQLQLKTNRVKNDVDEAIRQTEVIEKDVQEWLTRVEKELGEAQNLEDEIERNKCFKWCPNWGWRYCLSKKVAKKTLCISRLLETSDFPRVGHRAPLQGIEFLLSNDFMPSESSKTAFNGIMKALSSDSVNIIGLYGMPGVGKTTLVEEVGKQAREQKLFDNVVILTVSQTPNINEIQDKIAEILGLKFEAATEGGKAEELWRRLKGEKKILIIIDDVWNRLELKHIGIPFGAEHEGCKILLTTRLQRVCTKMNCQEKFQLDIFSESEAWALFKDNAGLENASPTLNDVAKEVARECKGLPLAVVTMARALKDETLDGWEIVNQRLKDSRHLENQDVCGGIYSSLKISYDYLKGNNSRTCLQLCSLFPEDHEIKLEELTICGIGQGTFHDVNSIEDARREMRVTITNLQKSGLLLETNDVRFVKMHDVVRDFVHWITSEGENMFLVKSGLKEWPRSESLGCCTAISLIKSDITNFPDRSEFPKLEAFLLDGWGAPRVFYDVPSLCFQGMKALKVLFLRYVSLSLEGLQFLPNLRTLQLECCLLRDASSLGNLKKLEILIIDDYGVYEEPDLTGLTTLRLLRLYSRRSRAFSLRKNMLSSLVQLEELNLGLPIEWASRKNSAGKASLSELRFLSRLTHLSLQVFEECIPENFVFPPLQRYNVVVNEKILCPYRLHGSLRCLTITEFSLTAFEKLFHNVEELALRRIMDLEYLIDTTKEQGPKSAFNILVRLTLKNMICLKELCRGLPPIGFLQKLEFLTIKNCPNAVFELAAVKNLKELKVKDCGQLQVIFQMDGVLLHTSEEIHAPLQSSMTSLHLELLPELRSIWKMPSHHLISLQTLREVTIRCCNKLKSVFSLSLAQTLVRLERLDISNCNGLEQVFDYAEERDGTEMMHPNHQLQSLGLRNLISLHLNSLPELRSLWTGLSHHVISLQSLREVTIRSCNKLKFVFPFSLARSLVHLQGLDVSECDGLEKVFYGTEETDHVEDITLPQLHTLLLTGLLSLRNFYTENNSVKLPSLKKLAVRQCSQLTHFKVGLEVTAMQYELEDVNVHLFKELFCNVQHLTLHGKLSPRSLGLDIDQERLNELTLIKLESCGDLECLIEQTQELYNNDQSPKMLLPKLQELIVRNCKDMLSVIPATINLEKVTAESCIQLQVIFQMQGYIPTGEENEEIPLLSNLKELKLDLLPELRCVWKGPTNHVNLQSMREVTISYCNKLKSVFSLNVVQTLVHLERLEISNCNRLEQVFDCAEERDGTEIMHSDHQLKSLGLRNLIRLHLDLLPELRSLWPGPSHHVTSLQSLREVTIRCCHKLKFVFPFSLARSLVHLQELSVLDCDGLQQVLHCAEETDHVEDITLPQLHSLVLTGLLSLRNFYTEKYFVKLPSLKMLAVRRCGQLTHCKVGLEVAPMQCELEDVDVRVIKELFCNVTLHGNTSQKSLALDTDQERINELTLIKLESCGDLERLIEQTQELNNHDQSPKRLLPN